LALNFDHWAKFQTFRHLTTPVLLGQFQHWSACTVTVTFSGTVTTVLSAATFRRKCVNDNL